MTARKIEEANGFSTFVPRMIDKLNTTTARDYFYRVVNSTFKNPFHNNRGTVYSANIKTDGLNNSNHWGFLSIVASGNNINVYTNVGRTDGDTSKGDIKECSATVID